MSDVRVRFAPSPTGHVHIGNIRAAIFNYLFARHEKGTFLLRIEDTDLERSTPEAIETLLQSMQWLGLDYDESIMYQTSQLPEHKKAIEKLIQNGDAYLGKVDETTTAPLYFRIPWDVTRFPCVKKIGTVSLELHPDVPFEIDFTGVSYAQMSRKGKPMEEHATLAGFHDLVLFNEQNEVVFELKKEHFSMLLKGEKIVVQAATKCSFTRHDVFYHDLVKGELAKPLDTIRDFVIVRSNGSPVFHIANVVDDATQQVTHIIRGDDHVENTYRHLFLFYTLGVNPPAYAHLPMIVNHEGKPYSKRDGDAFVGDFKTKGYLADALINYLALLGWSSPDGRDELSREELIELFTLDRVSSAPAKLDMMKLQNLNGLYLNKLSNEDFCHYAWDFAQKDFILKSEQREYFEKVAMLMRSRTRCGAQISDWAYFFSDDFPCDEKAFIKAFSDEKNVEAMHIIAEKLKDKQTVDFNQLFRDAEQDLNTESGKFNPLIRLAVTGLKGGADLVETCDVLGIKTVQKRLLTIVKK